MKTMGILLLTLIAVLIPNVNAEDPMRVKILSVSPLYNGQFTFDTDLTVTVSCKNLNTGVQLGGAAGEGLTYNGNMSTVLEIYFYRIYYVTTYPSPG